MNMYVMYDEEGNKIPDKEVYETLRSQFTNLKTVYNDRMRQWDYDKYRQCVEEVFGPRMGDYLPDDYDKVSEFLTLYFGTKMKCCVMEYFEDARGFPLWRIDYQDEE